ncbi:layilin [Denticeps clupeoides]|uniref:layilin n=1 Tax=Denticeps clupeoides TaxID=299321 RepID=UPI0010A3C09D|nr:layilin-like [Denticeps clupeoides]
MWISHVCEHVTRWTFLQLLLARFYHAGSASKLFSGQRICRRGTERPCYRIASIPDSSLRVGFEAARQACRHDGGELASIESENEQRLVEQFLLDLGSSDTGFWIGLRWSSQPTRDASNCKSRYQWLNRSPSTFRNWRLGEPSCGHHMCVALGGHGAHFLFGWSDESCNMKNNFICKYSEEKEQIFTNLPQTPAYTELPVISMVPKQPEITGEDKNVKTGASASPWNFILITVPTVLMLLLVALGLVCFRVISRRRKEQSEPIYARPGQWVHASASQTPCSFSSYTQPGAVTCKKKPRPSESQYKDYENVDCKNTRSGFVTNDIYETCRNQSASETGWVDNEIYG